MNGNVTEDGIRKDLEWMHRAGIGGVFLFDAGNFKKQIVEERLPYMSEGWKDAQKKLVWSETPVTGGTRISIKLPQPDSHLQDHIQF